jgi:hypothetical protein
MLHPCALAQGSLANTGDKRALKKPSAPILPRFPSGGRSSATSGSYASQWVGTGRTAVLCLPIPPVVTVRAAFTAHGGRLVGPFSSSSGDMDLRGEFVDFPTYPRLREG